jgi:hypothetical protein
LSARAEAPDRIAQLQRAMRLIADAVEDLPAECRDLAGNALLNIAAEAVTQDVGCAEAGRIFSRLADLLARGLQPPIADAISLHAFERVMSECVVRVVNARRGAARFFVRAGDGKQRRRRPRSRQGRETQ